MARFVFIGLSITSSWGNGHATTYRALIKALAARGHEVTFLEQDQSWYRDHRDLPNPPFCRTRLYRDAEELFARYGKAVHEADAVVVGSYVENGAEVGAWACGKAQGPVAFYDIDTPVTLEALANGDCRYLTREVLAHYDLVLSFTGGPVLRRLEELGARRAAPLYCSVDPALHAPQDAAKRWALGYLGTYSPDRQPGLEELLLKPAAALPAQRFAVAGAQYPAGEWPANVEHIAHLPPQAHAGFYCSQRLTLNLTRAAMRATGYAPSVRLFEAAACGVPVASDLWPGLETFFVPGREIFCVRSAEDVERLLSLPEETLAHTGAAARARVLREHTARHRALALEALLGGAEPASSSTLGTHAICDSLSPEASPVKEAKSNI